MRRRVDGSIATLHTVQMYAYVRYIMPKDRIGTHEAMCLIDLRSCVRQYGLIMVVEMVQEILSAQTDMLILAELLEDAANKAEYRTA